MARGKRREKGGEIGTRESKDMVIRCKIKRYTKEWVQRQVKGGKRLEGKEEGKECGEEGQGIARAGSTLRL